LYFLFFILPVQLRGIEHCREADADVVASDAVHFIKQRLNEFMQGFSKATGFQKKRLLRRVLQQLVLGSEGVSIFFHLSDTGEVPINKLQLVRDESKKASGNEGICLISRASGEASKLSVFSSDIRKLGDDGQDRTADLEFRKLLLYPTELHRRDV
jgi:hypothetical protein